jgi:putative ABC transport system substrate-binding protein
MLLALLLAAGCAAIPSWPQQGGNVPIVGMLVTHPPVDAPVVQALRSGLRKFGYEDGRNVKLEVRTALGHLDRVPALARELVQQRVAVIVVVNEVALRAVQQATSTIPIVMVGFMDDPVELGWIESYRRPGSNVTGIFNVNSELVAKRLEILKETLPSLSRVAVFWDPAFGRRQLEELQRPAGQLGVQLESIEISGPQDLEPAFKTAKRRKAGAVLMLWSPVFYVNRARIGPLALDAGLPTISDYDLLVRAGCLMSYGSEVNPAFERAAYFVDRLLNGAKAEELPVEQISKLKLIVNLNTARALGVKIPDTILLRADEVIR